jgi:hypothetical protein
MNTLKKPLVAFAVGVLVGYVFNKVLDRVPVVNRLPKVRATVL